eukprot:521924-Prorocentrum_minimum.AAC.1
MNGCVCYIFSLLVCVSLPLPPGLRWPPGKPPPPTGPGTPTLPVPPGGDQSGEARGYVLRVGTNPVKQEGIYSG